MFDGSFRVGFEKVVAPLGAGLVRVGISPDVITGVGVTMAAACAVAIGNERFFLAAVLLLLTGLPDALDGAVAKASGTSSMRGAYLDSVSDRLSDGFLFAGCGWYLASGDEPRLALLPFGLYIAASLVSYQRAKAESLGYEAKGGLMERAERFIVLGFGLLFSSLLVPVLWVMFALTVATAVFRFIKVWRQASVTHPIAGEKAIAAAERRAERQLRPRAAWRSKVQDRADALQGSFKPGANPKP
jgi:CDP-diacylglycerol--glycerol-3-phosphate 3-phosphatidyltransferase